MVCPNCGAQLPNSAVLCYSCRTQFDHSTHKYYPPDVAKYFPKDANKNVSNNSESNTDNLKGKTTPTMPYAVPENAQQQQIQQLNQRIQQQQQQIYQMQNSSNNLYYHLGLITGILAGVFIIISTFTPFITASAFGFSQSASLAEKSSMYLVLSGIMCIGLVLDSVSLHGKSNIGVGIIILLYAFYAQYETMRNIEDNDLSGLAHMGVGFYLIIVSAILAILSGIFIIIHNNQD